ncbi:NAD(P)-dependent dehydrogenase (short-subunit alcohol dehydrogenase family) [Sphingobium fontiphilum]|uniref:NAD(P)-dependent dehydrogenase (Short-subunit alcohol dehydrogenase family) n=1 Tax=Sphingobium fontiphilum TaxID=944425 RepID=A0A7W6DFH8_9SPHN|nr:oxidoreductase [Sphingobium fontiphilum]MBB3981832.1 NAD(P)-dependent dehydrogenase (short-subunit alcohol dehydrogenase family) [Sphingobium fontiphilum]
MTGFTAADLASQQGKCFIVTGANAGLGFETSRALAARGARILLACRDEGRARDAMARIAAETPGADLAFIPLDQGDLASIRDAAALAMAEPRIDALVNNAGVMIPPLGHTRDGFELQFGVNHLGCFALTALLLPKLAQTAGSRVVITASLAHKYGRIDWNDLNADKSYGATQRYCDSKLANILFLFELDRRLRAAGSPVIALGCHPGVAVTDLGRHRLITRIGLPLLRPILNSAAMGAWPTLQAAAATDVIPGEYYGPQQLREMRGPSAIARRAKRARNVEQARRLWDISATMTGIDPGLLPVE